MSLNAENVQHYCENYRELDRGTVIFINWNTWVIPHLIELQYYKDTKEWSLPYASGLEAFHEVGLNEFLNLARENRSHIS